MIARTIYLASIIMFFSCNKKDDVDEENNLRDNYLVDKISYFESSSNYKIAEYFYDSDNKLLKRLTTGKMYENNQVRDLKYVDEFEYKNGLVSKIRVQDSTHFLFSYDIDLFYNSQKNLIRQEIWKNESMIGYRNFYYENNLMVSIYNDETKPFETNTIVYNNLENVIKHIYIVHKKDDFGLPISGEYEEVEYLYDYDNGSKPNFGIDYLFVYKPLIGIGDETGFARELSRNNLTKFVNSGTTWTFSYDENGLPTEFEMKWKGIETVYPMIFEITYKRIK
ncbi:MAG: hypothetical protein JXA16_15050 [Bacteroidales bacterium]|nr:hypothetical protein [Bacteroidales bacterium]